jgi:hypothetical protein
MQASFMLGKRPLEAKSLQLLWVYSLSAKADRKGMPAVLLRKQLAKAGHSKTGALFFQLMDVLIEKGYVTAYKTDSPRRTYYMITSLGQDTFWRDYFSEKTFLDSIAAGLPLEKWYRKTKHAK